jgi:hypothetical protein
MKKMNGLSNHISNKFLFLFSSYLANKTILFPKLDIYHMNKYNCLTYKFQINKNKSLKNQLINATKI